MLSHEDKCSPPDVACAWQGEAWAVVEVSLPRQRSRRVRLSWNGGAYRWVRAEDVGAYQLELRRLEPLPSKSGSAPASQYRALIAVRPRPGTASERAR